jgi:hypothetical protein
MATKAGFKIQENSFLSLTQNIDCSYPVGTLLHTHQSQPAGFVILGLTHINSKQTGAIPFAFSFRVYTKNGHEMKKRPFL